MEGVAFEGVREATVGLGEGDGRLTDEAAITTSEPRYGQPERDGLTADWHGANGAFFGPVANDVGRLAVRATVVLGILLEVERNDAVLGGRSQAIVLAKPERAIEYIREHAVLLKKVWLPFKKRHVPPFGQQEVRTSRMSLKLDC